MGRIFGTDGIRGVAGVDITPELAMNLGRAAASVLKKNSEVLRPCFVIGKDTRISGDMLESAIASGLCSVGADVTLLGVVPTPAVAHLVKKYGADGAVVISASHNPFADNGIKFFDRDGYKLPDSTEDEIESIVLDPTPPLIVDGDSIGTITYSAGAHSDYAAYLASVIPQSVGGIRALIDCANGSASSTAAELFSGIGADFTLINDCPNGVNINDGCGSTHIESLCPMVTEGGYDVGIAFDGDADRCMAVDELGEVVDGDMLLAIFACYLFSQEQLKENCIVATIMSNIGLHRFAEIAGLRLETTKVGDRYVLERMREMGYNLGGEQSGHITFLDYMTTGDGQLCAALLLYIMASTGLKLSELKAVMKKYPQVLVNVNTSQQVRDGIDDNRPVCELVERYSAELGDKGRILVRPSGTELLVRVMAEGEDIEAITKIVNEIAAKIEESH